MLNQKLKNRNKKCQHKELNLSILEDLLGFYTKVVNVEILLYVQDSPPFPNVALIKL